VGLCATGAERGVEIESQWTTRKRERLRVVLTLPKAHPPRKKRGKGGATAALNEMTFLLNRRKSQTLFLDTLRHIVTEPVLTFETLTA